MSKHFRLTLPKYTTQILKIALAVLLVAIQIWVMHIGWHAFQLVRLAGEARGLTSQGLGDLDGDQATSLAHRAARHLTAIEKDMRGFYPVIDLAARLPGPGPYVGQVRPLLVFSVHMAQAGDALITGVAPFLDQAEDEPSQPLTERLFAALAGGEQDFQRAIQALQAADQVRGEIRPELLPARVQPLYRQLDENFPLLVHGAALLPLMPELLGGSQTYNYLVVAQNRDELRGTGGFITGLGIVALERGQILSFEIGDSYSVDDFSKPYPPPPEPLQRLMLAGYWVARDANWSPDFPTAARQLQELYTLSTDQETQGVVAFDQEAVRAVIAALGPIQLAADAETSAPPETITAANVESFMQQAWAPDPGEGLTQEWWAGRKDFMRSLGQAILQKLFQTREPQTLAQLGRTALELLRSGHVLVYLNLPAAQEQLTALNLDNRLDTGDGDFLLVVDSNFGFNKVDALVQREVAYTVDLRDLDRPRAKITLHYTNPVTPEVTCRHIPSYGEGTYADLQHRCYWNYWRLYRPQGNTLLLADTRPVPGELLLSGVGWPGKVENYPGEAGSEIFAGVLVLPTGEQASIHLQMALPASYFQKDDQANIHYQLRLMKQPGLQALPFTLSILLPAGYQLTAPDESWRNAGEGEWIWEQTLVSTQEFELVFRMD